MASLVGGEPFSCRTSVEARGGLPTHDEGADPLFPEDPSDPHSGRS